MFSKFSQFTQSLQDELGTPRGQKQLTDPEAAKKILSTETPQVEAVTNANEIDKDITVDGTDNKLLGTNISISDLTGVSADDLKSLKMKLAKFQKYDSMYPKLHEAYKIEKKKTSLITAFEQMLHELTPVTSIGELDSMRDYLTGLNQKMTLITEELAKSKKERDQLSGKVKDLEAKVKDKGQIEWKLREADVKLRQLEIFKKNAEDSKANEVTQPKEEELNDLKKQLKDCIDSKHELEAGVAAKQKEHDLLIRKLETNLKAASDDKSALKLENSTLQTKFEDLQTTLDSNSKLIDKFKEKISTLSTELENTKSSQSKIPSQQQQQNFKKSKKKGNKAPVAVKETEVPDDKPQIFSADHIELNHQVEELENKLNNSQKEVLSLNKSITNKNEEIENLKDMLRDVGDSLVQAKDASKDIDQKVKDLQTTVNEKESEIENKKNDLEMLRIQNSNALKDYEKTKINMNRKLDLNIKRVEELTNELNAITEKYKKIESERDELKQKCDTLSKSEASLSSKVDLLQKDNETKTKELENAKISKDNDSKTALELQNVKSQLNRKEKVLSEAESRIKFLQEEKNKLNDSLIEFKVQFKQISSKEKEFEETKTNLAKLNQKLKADLTENNIELNKIVLERNQLKKQVEELEDKYSEVKDVKVSSNEAVDVLKKKLDELNMINKEFENKIEIIQEELTQARSMLQDRTRESSTMRKILMDNEESQNNEMKELKVKFEKLVEEKNQKEDEFLSNIKLKTKENEELKRKLRDCQLEIQNLSNERGSLLNKIDALSSTIASSESQRTQTTDELGRSQRNSTVDDQQIQFNSKLIESLRNTLESTEMKLRESDEMNSRLRKANQETSDKLVWFNKKYRALSHQYKRRISESERSRSGSVVSVDPKDGFIHNADTRAGINGTAGTSDSEDFREKAIYIKNVLLGFLEHKDQRQMLFPVIKMLLYLTDDDEKKLSALLN